jgi:chromosome segregation ATPase
LWIVILTATTILAYQWISFANTRLNLQNAISALEKQKEILRFELASLYKQVKEKEQLFTLSLKEKYTILEALYKEKQRAYIEAEHLRAKIANLQNALSQKVNDNTNLGKELTAAKEELRLWDGKIKNLKEKRVILGKIAITKKALTQREKAIRDSSRALCYTPLATANYGYLVKKGSSTSSGDTAVELERIIVEGAVK